MRNNDLSMTGTLTVLTLVMLVVTGNLISKSTQVESSTIHLYGWAAVGLILIASVCLLSKIYRLVTKVSGNENVDTEIVTLMIMIVLLSGCAYWSLIINGDYDTTYKVLIGLGGFI